MKVRTLFIALYSLCTEVVFGQLARATWNWPKRLGVFFVFNHSALLGKEMNFQFLHFSWDALMGCWRNWGINQIFSKRKPRNQSIKRHIIKSSYMYFSNFYDGYGGHDHMLCSPPLVYCTLGPSSPYVTPPYEVWAWNLETALLLWSIIIKS